MKVDLHNYTILNWLNRIIFLIKLVYNNNNNNNLYSYSRYTYRITIVHNNNKKKTQSKCT